MSRNRIWKQAMMIAVIPILLMSVLLEGYSLYQRLGDLERSLIARSRSLDRQLAATSEYAMFSGNADLLRRYLDATMAHPDVRRVVFYDAFGSVMMDSGASEGPGSSQLPLGFGAVDSFHEDERSLWVYEPVIPTEINLNDPGDEPAAGSNGKRVLGGALIEVSKDKLNEGKAETLFAGLLITGAVCLISLFIAFRAARRIARPIVELNRAIQGIGEGDFDPVLPKFGVTELDELGKGVASMARLLQQERNFLEVRIREATEGLRREKELAERMSEEKGRFLAAAGHDLRQPLAAANLFVDALSLTDTTPAQAEIIRRLEQAMATFNGLLDSLLNISKLDAGVIKPEYSFIDVIGLFDWLERNSEPLAREKQLGFRRRFPAQEELTVYGDIGLVKSILMNLVSNAIKYTSRGAILVSVRRRGTHALFQVWDTGVGIPEELCTRIFDEFFQVNNPHRDRTRGLGLGLSIARRAVSLMGGEIRCRSRFGRGSVFEFRLPLADAAGPPLRKAAPDGPQSLTPDHSLVRGRRFLVVEDDALVAQATAELLRGMGGEVALFHNGEDALAYPELGRIDYFVSDYMIEGAHNGMQFLNRVREKLRRPINAVLMTGDTSPEFMVALTDCAWTVLHKPVKLTELVAALGGRLMQ